MDESHRTPRTWVSDSSVLIEAVPPTHSRDFFESLSPSFQELLCLQGSSRPSERKVKATCGRGPLLSRTKMGSSRFRVYPPPPRNEKEILLLSVSRVG